MLRLATPVVVAEVGWIAMQIVDIGMVWRLGPEAIGAVGVGSALFFALGVFGMGLLLGLDTLVSQALAVGPGAEYREVFRLTSTVAFAGYSLALLQGSIWYKHGWGFTLKTMFDGLVYALLTGGVFGWLWP